MTSGRSGPRGRSGATRLLRVPGPPVRTAALAALLLGWWAVGPLALLLALLLLRPGPRRALAPGGRHLVVLGACAAVLVAAALLLPRGMLPVPPGGGAWMSPAYVGRPVTPQPLAGADDRPGPLGLSVEVETGWYAGEQCRHLLVDAHERLVALCDRDRLLVVDPRSLRVEAGLDLPAACADVPPVLAPDGLLLVATGDRQLLRVATTDGVDEPDLVTTSAVDLSPVLADTDCVVAVVVDGAGRAWFATAAGVVGVLGRDGPRVAALEEPTSQPLAADRDGVYVTTTEAVHRVVTRGGTPLPTWRAAYETGSGRKDGQVDGGSGSGVVLLDPGPSGEGLLALTDNANPRMHVVVLRAADGSQVCREQVFDDDASATEAALAAVEGTGVVVANAAGPGVARVDVTGGADGSCTTTWTSEAVVPTSGTTLSASTGLLLGWSTRLSWTSVDPWYLTALDARTGRTAWAARGGTGPHLAGAGGPVLVGPGGAAYVGTRAGLVRVTDGTRGHLAVPPARPR